MAEKYIETIGRRKTASARVRLTPSAKQSVTVNGKPADEYFATRDLLETATAPLKEAEQKFVVTVVVHGGGISGQADATRHGVARGIITHSQGMRSALKKLGFLKRDPRAKERRKPGFKKARKRGQWSKR
jgi:small subunit ribosomal protein S9